LEQIIGDSGPMGVERRVQVALGCDCGPSRCLSWHVSAERIRQTQAPPHGLEVHVDRRRDLGYFVD
jgi:hypothetical protein